MSDPPLPTEVDDLQDGGHDNQTPHERVTEVLEASRERLERERVKREKLQAGELSYDLDGLRERVEA